MNFLRTPFPRPKRNRKSVLLLLLIGLACSLFILIFKPFKIENQTGEWYIYLIIFSFGIIFSGVIFFMEFVIPAIFPKAFKSWNLGKALLWYPLILVVVSATIFFYKVFLADFQSFTIKEYFLILGRVLGIGITVTFFILGAVSFFNRKKLNLLSSQESYLIKTSSFKPFRLNISEVMYIVSDDNYVDVHMEVKGIREKKVIRSSLKNIESQIVNPISPIYRCHRKYLINTQYFKVKEINSRSMIISLRKYHDEIPVSKKYAEHINTILHVHP
ncbi:LytTR family DNA-binding domain-containing protein [Croceitalea sp. MTPC5]|uniref:LytTR family DNA-binding domain-containing protein n=1 Tax=Croceitalea sp. MTPC5 TaxID=3056565 RepID=UPI0030D3F175